MRGVGIVALCAVALIVGYNIMFPTYAYRYRLTISLDVDGQIHTGSSVIEVVWVGGPEFGDVGPYHPSVRGQAAFVDLGEHGAVVALLIAPSHNQAGITVWPEGVGALWLVPRAFGKGRTLEELPELTQLSGRRELTPDNMPRLIWFSNIADPKTARGIRPDDIPILFGQGARLVAAYVEITHDPIIVDIDKKLPWYKELADRQKAAGVVSRPYEFQLTYSMFAGDD
jgi:hypothetical protein